MSGAMQSTVANRPLVCAEQEHAGADKATPSKPVGGEIQGRLSGNSATFGLSLSAGGEGSIGVRDQDEDGLTEVCARISTGPITAGACVEPEGIVRALWEAL